MVLGALWYCFWFVKDYLFLLAENLDDFDVLVSFVPGDLCAIEGAFVCAQVFQARGANCVTTGHDHWDILFRVEGQEADFAR